MNIFDNLGKLGGLAKDAFDIFTARKHIEQIEAAVLELQKQITENAHSGRVCPGCGEKSLIFPNKEYQAVAGGNYRTGEMHYATAKKLVAVCKSCGWECDDHEFIKNCLHKL